MSKKDFLSEIEEMLPEKMVVEAKKEAQKEILRIRLSEIRRKRGVRQKNLKRFSQSGVSKLEARKDMKISTLIDYLDEIGMDLEIKAIPKEAHSEADEIILVRT